MEALWQAVHCPGHDDMYRFRTTGCLPRTGCRKSLWLLVCSAGRSLELPCCGVESVPACRPYLCAVHGRWKGHFCPLIRCYLLVAHCGPVSDDCGGAREELTCRERWTLQFRDRGLPEVLNFSKPIFSYSGVILRCFKHGDGVCFFQWISVSFAEWRDCSRSN